MMKEAAILVGFEGEVLYTHLPPNRTSVFLPDDASLWDIIWQHRDSLAGIAHSHPGSGLPYPSTEDISTFNAIEAGLGASLNWWIISQDKMSLWQWQPKDRKYYGREINPNSCRWFSHLHDVSYNLNEREDHA